MEQQQDAQQDDGQQQNRPDDLNEQDGNRQSNGQQGPQRGARQRQGDNGAPPNSNGTPSDAPDGMPSGQPGTGVPNGSPESPPPNDTETASGEDQANIDYAKKATKLALDYLRHGADQELLDELGWTQKDLNRFIQRWDQLHAEGAAPETDDDRSESFDDVLRSLGLSRDRSAVREHTDISDAPGNVTDRGTRSRPPSEYLDSYKSYLRRRQKENGR